MREVHPGSDNSNRINREFVIFQLITLSHSLYVSKNEAVENKNKIP